MNLFVSDPDPEIAAKALDDIRMQKMIVEAAQLLSSAMHTHAIDGAPYKPAWMYHKVTKWVAATSGNYEWTLKHFLALLKEFHRRRGEDSQEPPHKCSAFAEVFVRALEKIPYGELQPFCNCTTRYEAEPDTIKAYRRILIDKWNESMKSPTWKNASPPEWREVYANETLAELYGNATRAN